MLGLGDGPVCEPFSLGVFPASNFLGICLESKDFLVKVRYLFNFYFDVVLIRVFKIVLPFKDPTFS